MTRAVTLLIVGCLAVVAGCTKQTHPNDPVRQKVACDATVASPDASRQAKNSPDSRKPLPEMTWDDLDCVLWNESVNPQAVFIGVKYKGDEANLYRLAFTEFEVSELHRYFANVGIPVEDEYLGMTGWTSICHREFIERRIHLPPSQY